MKINLITDAPRHNLALMKISTYWKKKNADVYLNGVGCFDETIGSWLFKSSAKSPADEEGGPGINPHKRLPHRYEIQRPDYKLFNLDYSLGYTWSYCPRRCPFCVVPKQNNPQRHTPIWDFHPKWMSKICLLNNNTFSDLWWRDTFEEIWEADLVVKDENGYDLRLIDQEKAEALRKTRWDHGPKFSWDLMKDEKEILLGIHEINRAGFQNCTIHVLIGFNTTIEEDIYRCQLIHDLGHNPFPMIYENDGYKWIQHQFRRMIYTRYYKSHGNIEKAWKEYLRVNFTESNQSQNPFQELSNPKYIL